MINHKHFDYSMIKNRGPSSPMESTPAVVYVLSIENVHSLRAFTNSHTHTHTHPHTHPQTTNTLCHIRSDIFEFSFLAYILHQEGNLTKFKVILSIESQKGIITPFLFWGGGGGGGKGRGVLIDHYHHHYDFFTYMIKR